MAGWLLATGNKKFKDRVWVRENTSTVLLMKCHFAPENYFSHFDVLNLYTFILRVLAIFVLYLGLVIASLLSQDSKNIYNRLAMNSYVVFYQLN